MKKQTLVIKIGGSIILNRKNCLRETLIKDLFKIFSISNTRKIIVVGCGDDLHRLTYYYNLTDKPEMRDGEVLDMNKRIEGFFELYQSVERNLSAIVNLIPPRFQKPEAIHPAKLFIKGSKGSVKSHEIIWFNRKLFEKSQYLLTNGGIVLDENILISAISSDTIAAYSATVCRADRMFLLSDVDGVYTDPTEGKLLKTVSLSEIQNYKINGGMKDKLRRIKLAINEKIPTFIINGNYPKRISEALTKGKTDISSEIQL